MNRSCKLLGMLLLGAVLAVGAGPARAAEVLTVAVFNFESTDAELRDLGPKVSALLTAHLSAEPDVITVERAELEKVLGEQELSLSGTVSADTAAKVGNLTGAKVLVTGRIIKLDKELTVVAKIIGTETSRVYGEVVKAAGAGAISESSAELAKKIAQVVSQKGDTLVAKVKTIEDRVANIKKGIKREALPTVMVKIEERHFGGPVIDPAAETEMSMLLEKTGFTVYDTKAAKNPDIEFVGEAFSTYGMRKGNLYSCQARLELKVIDKATGKVLAVDRQTSVAVDLSEQIAAKSALQKAAAEMAERIIPRAAK